MTKKENKYKIGDIVKISKIFVREPHGSMVGCETKLAHVVEIKGTPTLGPAYSLMVEGKRLDICYWESDIDELYKSSEWCESCECDPCDCSWGIE